MWYHSWGQVRQGRVAARQAWLQPPIRRHQHPEGQDRGEGPVLGSLLCTGRYEEPDQGAATRSVRRPYVGPHDASQPAAGVLVGLRGCCDPDHPHVRAESHQAGEGSGRDHPHSAAENRRIRQSNDAKDLGFALLGLPVARPLQTGRSQPRSPAEQLHPAPAQRLRASPPLAPRMGSLRGGGSASAALPVHARSTDTSPRTAPNSLLPTFPEDALDPDLAPPLFRKARSRTLSTPGDGSGLGFVCRRAQSADSPAKIRGVPWWTARAGVLWWLG